ncbi:hypothetical protein [Niabella hibiscisoli]|uniref:hypothetical protein n=1 Tax=Niabella hibiscisoli TaxID=1825928 RepID=UPI001F10B9D8|nr:hypothetical protein [Niabella hibiscisoli]MCH5720480.1 hypothetical protein [Niabella hibiscisoli]
MNINRQILSVFLICLFHIASAQEKVLEAWHQSNPIEKVYLHLDRKDYFAGQTSWFKGYFFQTSSRRHAIQRYS